MMSEFTYDLEILLPLRTFVALQKKARGLSGKGRWFTQQAADQFSHIADCQRGNIHFAYSGDVCSCGLVLDPLDRAVVRSLHPKVKNEEKLDELEYVLSVERLFASEGHLNHSGQKTHPMIRQAVAAVGSEGLYTCSPAAELLTNWFLVETELEDLRTKALHWNCVKCCFQQKVGLRLQAFRYPLEHECEPKVDIEKEMEKLLKTEELVNTYLSSTIVFEDAEGAAFVLADELQHEPARTLPDFYDSEFGILITALNPEGKGHLSNAENVKRNAELHQALIDMDAYYAQGVGLSPDGQHSEAGFIVFDENIDKMIKLAIRFEQNAIFKVFADSIEVVGALKPEMTGTRKKKLSKVDSAADEMLRIIFGN